MCAAPATERDARVARVIDREVAPVWHDRFARMIYRALPVQEGAFVLDIHCGSGRTTTELLQRMDPRARVLAIEADETLVALAKTKVRPDWKGRVYFKSGDFDDVIAMEDDTYDLTIANLVLGERVSDWRGALKEMLRVVKPGGTVMCTVPLYGSWTEAEDLFEELLRDSGMRGSIAKLNRVRRMRPRPEHLVQHLEDLGLAQADYVLEQERFSLLFRSGREFLFSPVVEHGPLRLWKAILSADALEGVKPQALFWRFKESIDMYFLGHVLGTTVRAGLLRFRKPDTLPSTNKVGPSAYSNDYWRRFPGLDAVYRGVGQPEAGDDLDIDIDIGDDDDDDDDRYEQADAPQFTPAEAEALGDLFDEDDGLEVDDDLQLDAPGSGFDEHEGMSDPVRELLEEAHAASSGATGRLAALGFRDLAPLPAFEDDEIEGVEELSDEDLVLEPLAEDAFETDEEAFDALFERSFTDLAVDGAQPTAGTGPQPTVPSSKRKQGGPPPPPKKK